VNTDGERDSEGNALAQPFDRHHGWSVDELYRAAVEEFENGNNAIQLQVASGLDGVAGESASYAVAKSGGMARLQSVATGQLHRCFVVLSSAMAFNT
jgi:hypothetical protein